MLRRTFFLAGFLAFLSIEIAQGGPIATAYRPFVCGLDGPCPAHIGTTQTPTAAQAAVFSSALFEAYWDSQGISHTGPAAWTFQDVNAQGTIIGSVNDSGSVHGAFIYMQGLGLVCCTTDELFLSDINDANVVVGVVPLEQPAFALAGPNTDGELFSSLHILPHPTLGADQGHGHLSEISNDGRVLGVLDFALGGGTVALNPVPEPGTGLLAMMSLMVVIGRRALKGRKHSAERVTARGDLRM